MSLQKYQSVYSEVSPKYESSYIDPPCGDYECRVTDAEYKEIKKSDETYDKFSWTLESVGQYMRGAKFQRVEFLPPNPETAKTKLAYIKGAIEKCGVKPAQNIMDLPLSLKRCIGAEIAVKVMDAGQKDKSGKEIKNIKFVKSISGAPNNEQFGNSEQFNEEIPY